MTKFKGTLKGELAIDLRYNTIHNGVEEIAHIDSHIQTNEATKYATLFAGSLDLLKGCEKAFELCDKLQMPTETELNELKDFLNKVIDKAIIK